MSTLNDLSTSSRLALRIWTAACLSVVACGGDDDTGSGETNQPASTTGDSMPADDTAVASTTDATTAEPTTASAETSTGEGSEGTDPDEPSYPPCVDAACPGELECAAFGGSPPQPPTHVCTLGCNDVSDCPPAPASHDGELTCVRWNVGAPQQCFMVCDTHADCPAGMHCVLVGFADDVMGCAWPL